MEIFDKWTDFIVAPEDKDISSMLKFGEYSLFFKGYWFIFPDNPNKFCKDLFQNPKETLSKIEGEFSIVCIDKSGNFIAATDKIGAIKFYYSTSPLLISTNLWMLLKKLSDYVELTIDPLAIREMIFYHRPLNGNTFIKKVHFSLPGMYLTGNLFDEKSVQIDYYYDFRFRNKIRNENLFVRILDMYILKTIELVSKRYPESVIGIGLSGGLDSRIIPHYVLRYYPRQKIRAFKICEARPHKLLLAYDNIVAQKIADYYKIPLDFVEYQSEDIFKKALLDVYSNPIRTSNILKASFYDKIDVLITGSYGTIVGGHFISRQIGEMSPKELVNKIHSSFSILKRYENLAMSLLKGKIGRRAILLNEYPPLITKQEVEKIKTKIYNFVKYEKEKGKNNFDIFMKYHLSLSDHGGAFESLSYRKPSFSIYFPYGLKLLENSDVNLIIGRNGLKRLILQKVPHLSKIPGQNATDIVPIYCEYNCGNLSKALRKYTNLISFFIHGFSMSYTRWDRSNYFLSFTKKVLTRDNPLFDEIFNEDPKDVYNLLLSDNLLNPWILENVTKVKLILDFVFYKENLNYLVYQNISELRGEYI